MNIESILSDIANDKNSDVEKMRTASIDEVFIQGTLDEEPYKGLNEFFSYVKKEIGKQWDFDYESLPEDITSPALQEVYLVYTFASRLSRKYCDVIEHHTLRREFMTMDLDAIENYEKPDYSMVFKVRNIGDILEKIKEAHDQIHEEYN